MSVHELMLPVLLVNVLSFSLMGEDKRRARQGKRRIHSGKPPEASAAPAEEPPRRARAPEAGARRPGQRTGKPSGTRQRPPREDRFAGSLPVKRGKGSRKKSGRQ